MTDLLGQLPTGRVQFDTGYGNVVRRPARAKGGVSFDATLDELLRPEQVAPKPTDAVTGARPPISLSRHAAARVESRTITFDEAERARLDTAVDALAKRGAQEALVLTPDAAYLVGVPRAVVITAMPRAEAMGTVFTQIDSTYVAR